MSIGRAERLGLSVREARGCVGCAWISIPAQEQAASLGTLVLPGAGAAQCHQQQTPAAFAASF